MDEASLLALQNEISELEQKLADKKHQLEEARADLEKQTSDATATQNLLLGDTSHTSLIEINNNSPSETKIALFRSLFRGREDVYAKRFESRKTGKSGYQPACRNEWVRGICERPRINCGSCTQRLFEPVTDDVIKNHLTGSIVMGIYPLLQNETCHFLAIDFDKETWREDARAFMDTCKLEEIPASLERSRSGNGAHVWIFFEKPIPSAKARRLGSFLMTHTLDRRPEIGLDSFDRFFPNQDTMPKGGFGNLIALPLQKAAREKNHSIFLDENMIPHVDQWAERINQFLGIPKKDIGYYSGTKWKGMLVQYTGRLKRISHGKKEIQVYDYVDEKVPVLLRMYGRRLKGYKALGFTVG